MNLPIRQKRAKASGAGLYRRAEREPVALAAIPHPAIVRAIAAETVLTPRRAPKQRGRRGVPTASHHG